MSCGNGLLTNKAVDLMLTGPIFDEVPAKADSSQQQPIRVHFFEKGGHGFTLRPKEYPLSTWPDLCLQWFRDNDLIHEEYKPQNPPDQQ